MQLNKKVFATTVASLLLLSLIVVVLQTDLASTKTPTASSQYIATGGECESETALSICDGCTKPSESKKCDSQHLFDMTCTASVGGNCQFICMSNLGGTGYEWTCGKKCTDGCDANAEKCAK